MLAWTYYGNSLQTWLIAAAVAAGVYLLLALVRRLLVSRLHAWAQQTSNQLDNVITDLLGQTGVWFIGYLALFAGAKVLNLPAEADEVLSTTAVIVLLAQIGVWGNRLIAHWLLVYLKEKYAGDPSMQTMVGALGFMGRLALFSALLLMALQNAGIRIDTLLAGLGIGGIAVALAVQNVLGDMLASLSIIFDKPFLVGDFIILDNGMMGTVDHVGLKTTRIISLTGEELVVANNDLLKTRIRNYRKMKNRMVNFTLRVKYDTPPEKLRRIPPLVRAIVDKHPRTRYEWANLTAFGPYAFEFDIAYYVKNYEWYSFIEIREEIFLQIYEALQAEGVEIAYPTQMLLMDGGGPADAGPNQPAPGPGRNQG